MTPIYFDVLIICYHLLSVIIEGLVALQLLKCQAQPLSDA
jgi:hypothetical protein